MKKGCYSVFNEFIYIDMAVAYKENKASASLCKRMLLLLYISTPEWPLLEASKAHTDKEKC